jgi:hypothetical protein
VSHNGPNEIWIFSRRNHIPSTNLSGEDIVIGTWNNRPDKDHNDEYIRKDIAVDDISDLIRRNNELTRIAEELEYKLEKVGKLLKKEGK